MKSLIFFPAAMLLILTGCINNLCIRGEGPIETVTLNLDDFNSIRLSGSMNVEVSYGETLEVVAEGHRNIIDELETDVSGETWDISLGPGCFTTFELKIYIKLPVLKTCDINGSGNILIDGAKATETFSLKIFGSGNITVTSLSGASALDAEIRGSGSIEIEEEISGLLELSLTNSASGHFKGFPAIVPDCTVKSSGSGRCEVTATEHLDVWISGSGNVYYKGKPDINLDDTGSGRLTNKN
jgi:hypothetical protein